MFYSVKLTREKAKYRPKRGKNRGTHTQLLHARHATRTWQIFRTHVCFLRFTLLLSFRKTRILLEACIQMLFKNIFAMWEIEVRRTHIFKLLRKKYQNNLYHCHFSTTSLLTKMDCKWDWNIKTSSCHRYSITAEFQSWIHVIDQ